MHKILRTNVDISFGALLRRRLFLKPFFITTKRAFISIFMRCFYSFFLVFFCHEAKSTWHYENQFIWQLLFALSQWGTYRPAKSPATLISGDFFKTNSSKATRENFWKVEKKNTWKQNKQNNKNKKKHENKNISILDHWAKSRLTCCVLYS